MAAPDTVNDLGLPRLTARSVIASTLLGVTPPELPTRSLVGTAELLGIAPGTARVAMSRMVTAGELETTGNGYRLVSPALLARQARQSASRAGTTGEWDGSWRTYVVTGEARPAAERVELRAVLTARRYGELREGVWLRPDNLVVDGAESQARTLAACTVLRAEPTDGAELAARLWDLDGWTARALRLHAELDRLAPAVEHGDEAALAEGFVISAAVLRHLQADPLLPAPLLPADWPGADLRHRYDAFDRAFRTTLTAWQRSRQPATKAAARPE